MRTRKADADAEKSGDAKKTPPPKRGAAAKAAATPKSTPKSGGRKVGRRQSAGKAATSTPVSLTPDPKLEPEVVESDTSPSPDEKKPEEVTLEEFADVREETSSDQKAAVASPLIDEVAVEELADEKTSPASVAAPLKYELSVKEMADGKGKSSPGDKLSVAASLNAEEAVEVLAVEPEAEKRKEEEEKEKGHTIEVTQLDATDTGDNTYMLSKEDSTVVVVDQQMEELVQEVELNLDEINEPAGDELAYMEGDARDVTGQGATTAVKEEEEPQIEEDERMEISDMVQRRKMKKEQEIFVGGLDRDAIEEDLKVAFEKVGEVVEVRLHKDFATNKNKGFAFIKFANKEQASRALSELKNPIVRGKRCGTAPSEDNDTLFLGNICNTWTKEAIKQKLKDYGVERVEHITLVSDTQNEGLSRGFAFLEFSCHEDAMLAYKRLQKSDVIFGHPDRTAKVAFAEPLREPDPEVMSQVKSVFVDGLPPFWDEDKVKEQFKDFGEIEKVVLARNMSTVKRKDFGFVNFTSHESAVACVEGINDTGLTDGKIKMKVRARLANPLPKTQAVKGGMSGGYRIGYTGFGAYSRFGRGFGRGRFPSFRAGFQGGRGANFHGHGRGGRFSFEADSGLEGSSEFHFRRPFGSRGGRGFPTSGRHGIFRGQGQAFSSRRPFLSVGEFGRPFGGSYVGEDPFLYGDAGHSMKRPFSMTEHDSEYMEYQNRVRPRYDYPDSMHDGARYRDFGMGGFYGRDYYGPNYNDGTYPSYGGAHFGRGYYY
ncbi:heterogeneous nuclear ribonucleoprotein Q-like [Zingiber officinale]|uniref:heterogeneous nuclear ribonucleoprotein Q-like n=1 Tax=Zingiber officinale TaxID=94328 RepID=UPI001C4A8B66|nr:heterogeneous nuclear ribonucleoprotein Q-like [Zingiber officinale]XP_042393582.1 heterogeneous nuclear ribonucleoprotein Q-like [Zingiber officinale]